jgi:hypothetical protein
MPFNHHPKNNKKNIVYFLRNEKNIPTFNAYQIRFYPPNIHHIPVIQDLVPPLINLYHEKTRFYHRLPSLAFSGLCCRP